MNRSKIYISALFILILILAACSVGRVDMFNTTQMTAPPATGVDIDIGDGLITREDPLTPLSDTFYVTLTKKPSSSVTIGTITSADPGEVIVSPASLTFTENNWDVPQLVTVTGVDDAVQDGLQSVIIDLGITSSSDNDWNGLSPDNVTVYNLDDETGSVSPAMIVIIGDGLITREDPVTPLSDTFNVVLNSAPSADVTLGTIISMDTGEVTVSPSSLTFTTLNWDTPRTVTVTGVDDAVLDDIQSVTIDLGTTSSTDGAWNNLDPGDLTVYNMDDETSAPGVTVSAGSAMLVSESGTASSFAVVLDTQPSSDVSINVSVSDTTEGTITSPFTGTSGMITFTNATWNTPKTITVQGIDDSIADGNQLFTIVLGSTVSTDPVYDNTINPPDVNFTCVDNGGVAGVTVNAGSQMLVSESGTSSSFEVVLNSQPADDVTIPVSVSIPAEGTISAPFSGASGTITFTIGNWNLPQTITVTGVDDGVADGNKLFTVVLGITTSPTDLLYDGIINPPDVNFMSVDDMSGAGVTVNAGLMMLVSESGTSSSFEVVLNSQPADDVTIPISVSDPAEGTITVPPIGAGGSITFTNGNWNIPQIITVTGLDDGVVDGNKLFTVVLGITTSPTDLLYDGIINPPDVNFTSVDDGSGAGVTVNAGSMMLVSESGTSSSFEVVLNSQPTDTVTIPISVSDPAEGTITVPPIGAAGTITFDSGNWNLPQTITVTGLDDGVADGNKLFNVVLGMTTSPTDVFYDGTIDPPDVNFTSVDDGSGAGVTVNAGSMMLVSESGTSSSFEVVLNSQPTDTVTIPISVSDPAEGTITVPPIGAAGSITFDSGNWNLPQTITVTGVDDGAADGNKLFNVVLGITTSPTDVLYDGTIDPPDVNFTSVDDMSGAGVTVNAGSMIEVSESGTSSSFEVVLNSQPTDTVTIPISVSDPVEGTITVPPIGAGGSITFDSGNWNLPQTITVMGVDDGVADGNKLFNVVLGITTSPTDILYNGTIDPSDVNFQNVDDDTAGVTVITGSAMLVSESGTSSSFEIVLNSEPAAAVTIPISVGDAAEAAITVPPLGASGSISFDSGNWNNAQTITITGLDDDFADGNRVFTIDLGPVSSVGDFNYDGLVIPGVNFTNVDDDIIGITVDIGDGLITSEAAVPGSDTFDVVLNSQPTADVTISAITSFDTGEVTVSTASLTFTTANWNLPQTVIVTGVDDFVIDAVQLQPVTIDLGTAAGGDYTGFDPGDVTVYNLDNEIPPQILKLVTPWGYVTTENGGQTEIMILLSSAPANNVTLSTIQSLNVGEGTVMTPSIITFTPADWNVIRYIKVQGAADGGRGDGDIAYTVDLGMTTSLDPDFDGIDPGDVTVINRDYVDITWYSYDNTPVTTFASISGTGNLISNFTSVDPVTYVPEDEGFAFVDIGFRFYFLGIPYDEITIYTNGYASFNEIPILMNGAANVKLFDADLGTGAEFFTNILAPWWDDLTLADAGSDVYFETTGTLPNRVFTIEWANARVYGETDLYTFQLKIYESTNLIEFVYGPEIGGSNKTSASAGVREDCIFDGTRNYYIDASSGLYGQSGSAYDDSLQGVDYPGLDGNFRFSPP